MKFEYELIEFVYSWDIHEVTTKFDLMKYLNCKGEEGWEIINIIDFADNSEIREACLKSVTNKSISIPNFVTFRALAILIIYIGVHYLII